MHTFAQYKNECTDFGSSLKDRDDWLVCIGRNRESDHADESNFACALKRLGGESDTVEVVRFGHWACGWVEHIFVHPSREADAQAIVDAIDDYPILDEDDFSEREMNAAFQSWTEYGCREFAEAMQSEFDLLDSTRSLLEKAPECTLYVFESRAPYVLETEGDTVHVRAYGRPAQTDITRDQMAALLRAIKREIAGHS